MSPRDSINSSRHYEQAILANSPTPAVSEPPQAQLYQTSVDGGFVTVHSQNSLEPIDIKPPTVVAKKLKKNQLGKK